MRSMKLAVLAVAMLAEMAGRTQAGPLTFDFSFTNEFGTVSGTVTGQILGLQNNEANQAATQVYIDSYPPALGNIGATPIDVTAWPFQFGNEFTVSNGQVTLASFDAGSALADLELYSPTGKSELAYGAPGTPITVYVGASELSIDPVPTPEPATLTLLASGVFAAGGFGLWRKRQSA
jgi:hypothetical protein